MEGIECWNEFFLANLTEMKYLGIEIVWFVELFDCGIGDDRQMCRKHRPSKPRWTPRVRLNATRGSGPPVSSSQR